MDEINLDKLEKLKFYRGEIKQEYDLLSTRMSSYVTSQSFLCIAFASSMGNLNPHWGSFFTLIFPVLLAFLGISTSLQSYRAIAAAFETIGLWHIKQSKLFENDSVLDDYRIDTLIALTDPKKSKDLIYTRGLSFARWSPPTFIAAWSVFGILAIILHFSPF